MTAQTVQFIAIETSGLDPCKDVILELGIATLSTEGLDAESYLIRPPAEFDLSDQIVEIHTKSGLIHDLLRGESARLEDVSVPPAHLRICWAGGFAKGFLELTPLRHLVAAVDFTTLRTLAPALGDFDVPAPPRSRVADKLQIMLSTWRALETRR